MRQWLEELLREQEQDARYERQSNERRRKEEPIYSGDDTYAQETFDLLQKMIAAPSSEVVWRALERRSEPGAKSSREISYEAGRAMRLREADDEEENVTPPAEESLGDWCLRLEVAHMNGEHPFLGNDTPTRNIHDMARSLVFSAAEIYRSPISIYTTAKKRERLLAAERAVDALREALAPLWSGTNLQVSVNWQWRLSSNPLDQFAIRFTDQWLRSLHDFHLATLDEKAVAVAYHATKRLARYPFEYLDALLGDAREWADEPPELARPNDPNAARLIFIRRLTGYFRSEYGEPLRACVLSVASLLFDCSTLDESAIAKLAP